jgi:hypothetical protein
MAKTSVYRKYHCSLEFSTFLEKRTEKESHASTADRISEGNPARSGGSAFFYFASPRALRFFSFLCGYFFCYLA